MASSMNQLELFTNGTAEPPHIIFAVPPNLGSRHHGGAPQWVVIEVTKIPWADTLTGQLTGIEQAFERAARLGRCGHVEFSFENHRRQPLFLMPEFRRFAAGIHSSDLFWNLDLRGESLLVFILALCQSTLVGKENGRCHVAVPTPEFTTLFEQKLAQMSASFAARRMQNSEYESRLRNLLGYFRLYEPDSMVTRIPDLS